MIEKNKKTAELHRKTAANIMKEYLKSSDSFALFTIHRPHFPRDHS